MRAVLREDYHVRNQQIRPVFEPNQIQKYGIWIEIVPHKVRMVLTESGSGLCPKAGDFIRLKQLVYKQEDMVQVRSERVTYLYGRNQLIPGLQMCLSLCRENTKARCFISHDYAYGDTRLSSTLPARLSLVIDVEIISITFQPTVRETFEDELLLKEIWLLASQGNKLSQGGYHHEAQNRYEVAFQHIQSSRCKEIKNYLYVKGNRIMRSSPRVYHQLEHQASVEADKKYLNQLYMKFDTIKLTTVQLALKNKDFYKVILLSKECLMENSRLQLNEALLLARGKALVQVGQFTQGIRLIKHLSDKHPQQQMLKEQLEKALEKRKKVEDNMRKKLEAEPILSITGAKHGRPKRKQGKLRKISSSDI